MAIGKKTGGRGKGTPNKITRAFREAVQIAYDEIGGDEAFAAWARENPTDFYKIAARLIPHQIDAADGVTIQVVIQRGDVVTPMPIDAVCADSQPTSTHSVPGLPKPSRLT